MFELNKHHRESLLNSLEKINEEIELNKSHQVRMAESTADKDRIWMKDWRDMELFLFQESKKLILESIKQNEIDF